MKRISPMYLFLISVLLIAGCQNQGGQGEEEAKVPVQVQVLDLGNLEQYLNYNGDINAELEVNVFSKIPDRIEKYFVDEGDFVKAGDPIAKILATTIEQGVNQAQAALIAAQAQESNMASEFARAQRLYNEDAMSKQQFDAIQTQYEAVSAQVKQASAALASVKSQNNDATISAPISGIIGKRYFEAGDMAVPSMPVVRIVQMQNMKIKVDVTEEDLGQLAVGQRARVYVRTYPDEAFIGKTTRISPILDPITRMATVEIMIPNKKRRLKPGMYGKVDIVTGIIKNSIIVPRYAVIENTSLQEMQGQQTVVRNYFVYVVDDSSRAEQRQLGVQYLDHQSIAVESGLQVGEKMVISGQNNLRDGIPVFITEGKEAN